MVLYNKLHVQMAHIASVEPKLHVPVLTRDIM